MGNPFLFADRFSGAVVHLTTGVFSGFGVRAPISLQFGVRAQISKLQIML
jgi:hypothetical protein